MSLGLSVTSALNLTLEGSTGTFSVGRGGGHLKTIEVKYLLTHVTLDLLNGANEQLLRHLAPVREVFSNQDLGFDEIMQRDIDDARVSSELVPYLLDRKSRDLVKLFPPIVAVVVPVAVDANRPSPLYPEVVATQYDDKQVYRGLRSGRPGQEVFEFLQPFQDGKLYEHDLVRLKLNTNRCRLVIVDGQHRSMALLALYRNLKQDWNDKNKAPYKDFYEEWSPSYIRGFEIGNISLPLMICAFPELHENYTGEYNVIRAARSIFLTLNKTARQVSQSRNRLLDDADLVSLFLRNTLSAIKSRDDINSAEDLRIHNVELDQVHDRVKIESALALTGVNHIYFAIEHLLMNKLEEVNGAKPRAGNYSTRVDLEKWGALRRLNGWNLLGNDVARETTRTFYSPETANVLASEFHARFGKHIIRCFDEFYPYKVHASAVNWLDVQLRQVRRDDKVRSILFEGQGIGRTFQSHLRFLQKRLSDPENGADLPKLREVVQGAEETYNKVLSEENDFRRERARRFLQVERSKAEKADLFADDGSLHDGVVDFVSRLYENVLTTQAFQTALIACFFGEIEKLSVTSADGGELSPGDIDEAFGAYLKELNDFFSVTKLVHFTNLVELIEGSLADGVADWRVSPSSSTFRKIVFRGEMQPAQWPKYKYLLIELWRAKGQPIEPQLRNERDLCRAQVFSSLVKEHRKDYAEQNLKRDDQLSEAEVGQIRQGAYEAYKGFLRRLGWKVADLPPLSSLISGPSADDAFEAPDVEATEY